MDNVSVQPDQWMDHIKAPLNPCSIETLPESVGLANGSSVWPLMVSCYQLDDHADNNQEQPRQQRRGQLNLYMVKVPDAASEEHATLPLSFGEPHVVLRPGEPHGQSAATSTLHDPSDYTSGILDGKWATMPSRTGMQEKSWAFATAHSSGEIRIHSLRVPARMTEVNDNIDDDKLDTATQLHSNALYEIIEGGRSQGAPKLHGSEDSQALCLSLNWDAAINCIDDDAAPLERNRIVSSYSNGVVAIHDVMYSDDGKVTMIESDSWLAHTLFKTPAEVWSVCFAHKCFDAMAAVISCGDDGSAKIWDTRATSRPVQTLKHFDAGVTCVAPHPRLEHLLILGSYDETICLYDTRYFRPLFQSSHLGGGIWRLKWHPFSNNRLLVAAMHGGARVIDIMGMDGQVQGSASDEIDENGYSVYHPITQTSIPSFSSPSSLSSSQPSSPNMYAKIMKEFTEHKSMCYGADWLVARYPERNESYFEAAATCSFYDNAAFLWDSAS